MRQACMPVLQPGPFCPELALPANASTGSLFPQSLSSSLHVNHIVTQNR